MSFPVGKSNQMAAQPPEAEHQALNIAIIEHNQRIQRANPGCCGPNYTLVCDNCTRLFQASCKLSGWQRTSYEYECLRRVLLITDHTVLPVFCDDCYEQAVVPADNRAMWAPNLVLTKLNVHPPRD